jgi:peptidoglycan/LPS O-acetylase OafA/YrhL
MTAPVRVLPRARADSYPAAALDDVRNPAFASFLDMARWMAAAIVLFGHLRDPLFLGYGAVAAADRTVWVMAWYFVTGWFGEAVIVFFVLSGYLVGGLSLGKMQRGGFDPGAYAIDRFTRLYLPFLPAVVLTAVLDFVGAAAFASAGLYDDSQPMLAMKLSFGPFAALATPENFVGTLAMLQHFVLPPYGSNQPLWTIAAEFWFYVAFGCAAWLGRGGKAGGRLLSLLVLVAVFLLLGSHFPYYLGLWTIGMASALFPWRRLERPLLALAFFLVVLVAARLNVALLQQLSFAQPLRDYGVALAFAWLLVSMRGVRSPPLQAMAGFNRFMAGFSFSLYLVHFPLLLFLLGALHRTGWFPGIATGYAPTDPEGLLAYASVAAMILVVAWLFAQATEARTHGARSWLKAKIR